MINPLKTKSFRFTQGLGACHEVNTIYLGYTKVC